MMPRRGLSLPIQQEYIAHTRANADNLHSLFEAQVTLHPHNIAVVCDNIELTYFELNLKANQLAHYLKKAGVISSTIVAINLPRSLELIISFLAVLKAGGAYLPVDPNYPAKRINFMLEDSHASFLITHSTLLPDLNFHKALPICLDLEQTNIAEQDSNNLDLPITSHELAYVIYTSGSTGHPKGVLIEHGNIANATTASLVAYACEPITNLLLLLSVAFDGSFAGIYWTLCQGGKLVLPNEELYLEPTHLNTLFRDHQITDLLCTPTLYRACMPFIAPHTNVLTRVMVGGEICTEQLVTDHSHLFPEASLINIYGPTEATVWASFMIVYDKNSHQKANHISIGRAIDQVAIYILDEHLQRCATDVVGDIYIGGSGVSRGYLNHPELTAQHFIIDPFTTSNPNARLYKTGDRGCYLSDGNIDYLGRVDNQIKLLGQRIELEEIEKVLGPYAQGCQVFVTTQEENHIPVRLIAFLSKQPTPDSAQQKQYIEALRSFAQDHLPRYMQPAIYQFIETIPLSAHGKIDRKQLSIYQNNPVQQLAARPPQTDLEIQVHALWVDTLSVKHISMDANFFALGGHSLLAARIMTQIAVKLGKSIHVQDLYHAPTLAQFTQIVAQAPPVEANHPMVTYPHVLPLHELQFIYWVTKFAESKLKKYNVVDRKRLQGPIDKTALDAAFQWVLHKQDVFSYHIHHLYPLQTPCTKPSKQYRRWHAISLQHLSDVEAEAYLSQRYADLFYKKFWRVNTPWIQANLYYLHHDHIELQIGMSHLIADERSMTIFFQELSRAYLFITQHATLHNHELLQNYKHYITHKNNIMQHHAETDEVFWKTYLQDTGLFIMPAQYVVPQHDLSAMHTPLPEEFGIALREFCARHCVGFNDVLCAATSLALFQCCNQDLSCVPHKLLLSHLKSTRDDMQYDNVIGCFLRMDILKLSLSRQSTLTDLAKQAQQSAYETDTFQRASSLVKIAAVGKQPKRNKPFISFFTRAGLTFLTKLFPKFQLNKSLINACKTLAIADRTQQFFINVNIHNDFVREPTPTHSHDLLGLASHEVPEHAYFVRIIPYTLDIAFHRHNDQKRPVMTIATNLLPSFQKKFAETLISIIMKERSASSAPQNEVQEAERV